MPILHGSEGKKKDLGQPNQPGQARFAAFSAGSERLSGGQPAGLKLLKSGDKFRPLPRPASIFGRPASLLGDRLAVGLRTLTPSTLARIQVPQPNRPQSSSIYQASVLYVP